MTTQTKVRAPGRLDSLVLRHGLAEIELQPGDGVPTERIAKAVLINGPLASDWLNRYADPQKRHIRPGQGR